MQNNDNIVQFNAAKHAAWKGILTPRQAEVAEMVAHCHSNKQIAEMFFVEEQTIKFHIHKIYERLGLSGSDLCQRVVLARWWWANIERAEQPLSVVPSMPRGLAA
jgi:DNA-binding NarL/FixJ family response regulator